jgi:hypothetical protein
MSEICKNEDNHKAEGGTVVTEYLLNFFKALRSLEQDRPDWVSDGIAYDEGSLYVLVGMGDVRVRVPMREFDPDPAKAAEVAINRWRSMPTDERERAMESVKS